MPHFATYRAISVMFKTIYCLLGDRELQIEFDLSYGKGMWLCPSPFFSAPGFGTFMFLPRLVLHLYSKMEH